MDGAVVTVERIIPAAPHRIFELLSDPDRHRAIDGSGSVRTTKGEVPDRLSLGSTFGMNMKLGVPYSMVNEVIEFEQDRRIAWKTRGPGRIGRVAGGRIWRYELEPVEGGTRVRESWDLSEDKQRALLKLGPTPRQTRRNMEKTLERIEELLTG